MENSIPDEVGGIRWLIHGDRPGFAETLSRALSAPGVATLKRSKVRRVQLLPARDGAPPAVLKTYLVRGPGAFFRSLLLGPPARREWRILHHLRAAGVAVPEPLALGIRPGFPFPRRSYLATGQVEGGTSLEALLLEDRPLPVSRSELCRRLGRLVRSMHDAGVFHGDLHAANLLVDRWGYSFIVDLHGASKWKNLSMRKRYHDLCSLAVAFVIHGSRTDRLRFFKAYAERLYSHSDPREAARSLERDVVEHLGRVLARYDHRPLRPGSRFQVLRIHELTGMAEDSDRARALARFLGPYPEDILDREGELVHETSETRVYRLSMEGKSYGIKVYIRPGMMRSFKGILQGARARKSWVNYHRLRFRAIRVPRPVLYLEEFPFAPSGRSYVATEWVKNAVTLDKYMDCADRKERLTVLHRTAWNLARLHRLFLRNRDLKAQNILVEPTGKLVFVDPDGVESMMDPYPYAMAKDLMRLNASFPERSSVSRADRLRFLKVYMKHLRLPDEALREIWREVLYLTWEKWSHWKRKGLGRQLRSHKNRHIKN